MKRAICILGTTIFFIGILQACKKLIVCGCIPPAPTHKIRTSQILSYYGPLSGQPYDSIFNILTYDGQDRIITIATRDWSDSSGTATIINLLTTVTYPQGIANYVTFVNGSSIPGGQQIYYLNSLSLIDSAVHQITFNGTVWLTYERESYTYNSDSSASSADSIIYDYSTGIITRNSHTSYVWSGGNLVSSTIHNLNGDIVINTVDYYTLPPAPVLTGLIGPDLVKGISLTLDYPKTATTTVNGNVAANAAYTYTSSLNGITEANWEVNFVGNSSPFNKVFTYTYY